MKEHLSDESLPSPAGSPSEVGAALVLILGGTNDLGRGVAVDSIIENLLKLHAAAHAVGAATGVLTIPEMRWPDKQVDIFRGEREQVNDALRKFARSCPQCALLVDIAAEFPQEPGFKSLWEPDGVHFSPAGSSALGDLLATARTRF